MSPCPAVCRRLQKANSRHARGQICRSWFARGAGGLTPHHPLTPPLHQLPAMPSPRRKKSQHNYCLQNTLVFTAGMASLHPVASTTKRIHHTSFIPQVVSTKPVSSQVLIAYGSLYRSSFRDFLCRMPLPPLVPTNSRLYHWAFP